MFLTILFIYHLISPILADKPSYIPEESMLVLQCSSSKTLYSNVQMWSLHNGSKFEFSKVSRASVEDPGDQEFSKISACVFKKQVVYEFPVSPGPKFIRLHFYPTSYISKALFTVSVGHLTLLNTSLSSNSLGASNQYTIREFCVQIYGQILNITFTPSPNDSYAYGFVNKIEVVSVPLDIYFQHIPLPLVGHPSHFHIGNSTAFETMHRVNIGGPSISAEDYTRIFRAWSGDDGFLPVDDEIYTDVLKWNGKIKYSSKVPGYTAPVEIYSTARTSGNSSMASWFFPVDSGFSYLIRLHFCEIRKGITEDNQRVFQVYINNRTAEDHADVIHWSKGAGVPVYKDYVTDFSRHSQGIKNLSVAIQGHSDTTTHGVGILNGLEIFKLSNDNNSLAGSFYPFEASQSGQHNIAGLIIAVILLGIIISLLVCFFLSHLPWWCSHFIRGKNYFRQRQISDYPCRNFSLFEMKWATDNFCEAFIIGEGGFGKVYKGYIEGGTKIVAIKRSNPKSKQGLQEFLNEITTLSKLRHCHLVSLIGYCKQDKEMILVYDYMARGTLRDHLYKTQQPPLPWNQRLKICIGAARGLHYLHTGEKHTIIHRDVKSTNILLDENWVAKVSDFGLSKVGPSALTPSKTHVTTLVKGSFGYLDPEYYRRQKLTEKSDVYSFGVVLLEVLCATPAVTQMVENAELEQVNLAEWTLRCHKEGKLDQIIDPHLQGEIDSKCFKTFTDVAIQCLADRGSERPSMNNVLWNLELAWQQQQQMGADLEDEAANVGKAAQFSLIIDGQRSHCVCFSSDPTPGIEFSEIIHPDGR